MKTAHREQALSPSSQDRVCLPYGVNLLDMARWFCVSEHNLVDRQFKLVAGSSAERWQGSDVVELYCAMQRQCLSYSLADSCVIDLDTNSTLMFDQFQRFSAFSAERDVLSILYPFSKEIMWENFAIQQELDEEDTLNQIFSEIHTKE